MKASDFNLSQEISFDFEQGVNRFHENRLLVLDVNALGLLRQNMLEILGFHQTRAFFFKLGYQNGYSDFMQVKMSYEFDNESELLKAGPVMNTWEGKVKSQLLKLHYDRERHDFHYEGLWHNSYEAEQHLSYNEPANEPTCWLAMGYASGWSTQFFGEPVICIEQSCVGKGDDCCHTLIKPVAYWGEAARPYTEALKDLQI